MPKSSELRDSGKTLLQVYVFKNNYMPLNTYLCSRNIFQYGKIFAVLLFFCPYRKRFTFSTVFISQLSKIRVSQNPTQKPELP